MSFKLLAIRPLDGCNPKFLKNLDENRIYQFYNDYDFLLDENKEEVIEIKHTPTVPENLYYQKRVKQEDLAINISAIVGKNGSGKSALVELLVVAIFKLSHSIKGDFINAKELYYRGETENEQKIYNEKFEKYNKSIENDLVNINVEIFIEHIIDFNIYLKNKHSLTSDSSTEKSVFKIKIKDNDISFIENLNSNKPFPFALKDIKKLQKEKNEESFLNKEFINLLGDFFYSMIINYSHYGFNTRDMGEWLKGVFHKNDGYQLPIVINPYRDKGNIDINSEKALVSSRFLVNILQEEKLRTISKDKIITHISIEIDKSKLKENDTRIINSYDDKIEILKLIFEVFIGIETKIHKENEFFKYALDYLLIKLRKMARYPVYREFEGKCFKAVENNKFYPFEIVYDENLKNYLNSLLSGVSHITEKFQQALFFIRHCYLDKEYSATNDLLEINDLFKKINTIYNDSKGEKLKDLYAENFLTSYSLPSFFKVNYYYKNEISENNFNNLSSGEKQKIFSIHSVIYHIRNIDSVREKVVFGSKKKLQIKYNNVNIIFDEIELYAHPEFQRIFINDFLAALKAIKVLKLNINILFITHSPFILSDIPKQNILYLKTEKRIRQGKDVKLAIPQPIENKNSFGANIHDLLADSFFMKDGYMGEFAKGKIKEIIKWLNNCEKKQKSKETIEPNNEIINTINLIGEPVLKYKLREKYYQLFRDEYDLENEKKEVRERAIQLGIIKE